MKTFLKILLVGVILPLFAIGVIFTIKPSFAQRMGRSAIEYLSSNGDVSVKISDVHFALGKIELLNTKVYHKDDNIITVEKTILDYDIAKSLKKFGLYFDVSLNSFKIGDINLNASGSFVLKRSRTTIDNLKLDIGDKSFLAFSMDYRTFMGLPYMLKSEGKVENLPLMLQKAFWHIAPNNGIVEFLRDFILSGTVSGEWKLGLDKEFFAGGNLDPEDFSGNLKLANVDFKYDEEFPIIKNLNSDVTLAGTNIDFKITEGYSGKILLSNSIIEIDWSKGEDTAVIAKVKGAGAAVELTEFIPNDDLEGMKKYGIDLRQIKGTTKLHAHLIIPLKPGTVNEYDVTADVSQFALSAFDEGVVISSAKLIGKYDGKSVKIEGTAKVNDLPSDLFYQMNLEDDKEKEFDHLLKAKVKFMQVASAKHDVISAVSGGSVVDLEYKLKD
nr:hypothetical protein [Rickettsiaceae bacterium]